jgi:RNA polymerase sigma factor (sigma-70 family)
MSTNNAAKALLFESLIKRGRKKLLAALVTMLDESRAEEVLQEAAMRVYADLDSLETDYLEAYWFKIARNLAISRLRHYRVVERAKPELQLRAELAFEESDAWMQFETNWSRDHLLEAISALPPICKKVFFLRKIEGCSQREIAEELGISVNTVQNHLTQGMKLCREHLLALIGPMSEASGRS